MTVEAGWSVSVDGRLLQASRPAKHQLSCTDGRKPSPYRLQSKGINLVRIGACWGQSRQSVQQTSANLEFAPTRKQLVWGASASLMFAWKTAPTVGGASFLRKDIHKLTWKSPDGLTTNQIDHILINRKWGRSLQGQQGPRVTVNIKLEINRRLTHVLRVDPDCIPKVALRWSPPGKRIKRRLKTTWRNWRWQHGVRHNTWNRWM